MKITSSIGHLVLHRFTFSLASALAMAALVLSCGSDDATAPVPTVTDFGPPPPDLPPTPPANEASPSTNISTFPVVPLDDPSCTNATRAIFEFYHPQQGLHFHTNDFDEAMSGGYAYEFPMNTYVANLPGTIAVYRCHGGLQGAHFLSTDVNCEGGVPDNLMLGYIYDPALPQPAGTTPWFRSKNPIVDYYIHFSPSPPLGWTSGHKLGYGPSTACQNMATTCQMYPSDYTGYTVNPAPDPDTGEYIEYGDRAPNPPWFGEYGRAQQGGKYSDAILTGDWGTTNNVDWAKNREKAECGYTDWMVGLSTDMNHGGAAHAFRCAMSQFKLGARTFGSNCSLHQAEYMAFAGGGAFRSGSADWDPGYTKYSCGQNSYLAGVSSNPDDWNHLHGLLCCSEPNIEGDDCTTVVFGQPSMEQNTSTTADDNDNIIPYNWDPPDFVNRFDKAECGAGRRMMGASKDRNSRLHAILCCRTPPPPATRANASCCSPQTLQKALANCNADNKTYESDCESIVAPCCNSDPSSDGVGGGACAAIAASMAEDAAKADELANGDAAGTTSNGTSCGASGSPAVWSYGHTKGGGGGNKTFGGNYTGQVTLGAGPIYATGDAIIQADASLFGKKIVIARAELHGNITANDPLTTRITALGKDLYVYPHAGSSQKQPSHEETKSYTVTFFENKEVITLFAVPITITGTIAGTLGVTGSASNGGDTLTFNATPAVGATATCIAALGGGKGRFSLTAGVEGSLNLFDASLVTVASVSPFTNHVSYAFHSDLKVTSLDGFFQSFLKVKLKPFFRKTFKHTLATWSGITSTTPLFKYTGCMNY